MAVVTTRLIIVCHEAVVAQMRDTLAKAAPGSGATMQAGVALPSDPHTRIGSWTSWAMEDGTRKNIVAAFASTGWSPLKGSEGAIHVPSDVVPAWGSQRFWLFEADAYSSPYAPLIDLGLVPWSPAGEE